MRKVNVDIIKQAVKKLSLQAGTVLREDVKTALKESLEKEKKGTKSRDMMEILVENAEKASVNNIAICQDTGMAAVFLNIGQDVNLVGGDIKDVVNKGIEEAYAEGYFRKSVVEDPILRNNTGTNTPAVIHFDIVKGDKVEIHVLPKGFGAENKSRIIMLNPTCSADVIVDFCVETVLLAGPDACPPYVLGVGIGGTMEEAALISKKALLRCIDNRPVKNHISRMEKEIISKANDLKIGVMGLGGNTTVLGVNIETAPTHIAGLPVAVNVCCHALRSARGVV